MGFVEEDKSGMVVSGALLARSKDASEDDRWDTGVRVVKASPEKVPIVDDRKRAPMPTAEFVMVLC